MRDSLKTVFSLRQKIDYSNNWFKFFILVCFTLLSACQTLNTNSYDHVYKFNDFIEKYQPSLEKSFNGKFKLFIKDKGYTGTFKFFPSDDGHEMILLSPLNQIICKISLGEEILFEHNTKESQNIKNFIKSLPIKEFKRILYSKFNNKPVRVTTSYFEISVDELSKIDNSADFEPKIIKVKNKDIELIIILT